MSLVHPHGGEFSGYTIPTFEIPACLRHLLKGYRWWCRKCRAQSEKDFEEVCLAHWSEQHALRRIVDAPADTRLDVVQDIADRELDHTSLFDLTAHIAPRQHTHVEVPDE